MFQNLHSSSEDGLRRKRTAVFADDAVLVGFPAHGMTANFTETSDILEEMKPN